ncbi:MAG: hypothetical protein ACI4R9_09150 [Kiritimatiellia bacterium]
MAEEFAWNDRYAGDAAWTEWFDICSVAGCRPEYAVALRAEVASAMYAQLARCGFSRDDVGTDDPVAFFDSYFTLRGPRVVAKPLKSYFRYRIEAEGIRLVNFVCGTLFGSGSGRVRDIVIDWIATCKGWKAHKLSGTDGRRHLAWESAGDGTSAAKEPAATIDPAAFLDEEPIRRQVGEVLERLAAKIKVEKSRVALLLYVTALDISITEPAVLAGLGTGKSRAYVVRDKVMKALEKELKRMEGADDPLFGRLLLDACERGLTPEMRAQLGGAA